ncbi:MAG: hypothetical protein QF515_17160 [Pseudomonadales bacterium]|jgi:hypothetical protein|nr:hypothetical protein [Pseudomonadales bacterium]MDP6471558.1 hypothetical protein [Pseudomonadales bacterium]MDP6828821.1 hypothetical protein [Pseudomonadales bacterium]|tara:strand:+ start:1810 stop:2052 length:243 start_codon:yes stop_codon:yes gene_type:complete
MSDDDLDPALEWLFAAAEDISEEDAFAEVVTEVSLTTLIETDEGLAAQLLAPVNSVGSLLSAVLPDLRLVHRRIMSYGMR